MALERIGVLGPQRARRLERVRELRRLLVHEYASATAEQVHEAAWLVAGDFVPFYDVYRAWIARGFSAQSPTSRDTDAPVSPASERPRQDSNLRPED